MRHTRLWSIVALGLAAGPAAAVERFECHGWQVCRPDAGCSESQVLFDLTYLEGDRIELRQGYFFFIDREYTEIFTLAWRDRDTMHMMWMMGDGAAILTRIPERGGRIEQVETIQVHCSPA